MISLDQFVWDNFRKLYERPQAATDFLVELIRYKDQNIEKEILLNIIVNLSIMSEQYIQDFAFDNFSRNKQFQNLFCEAFDRKFIQPNELNNYYQQLKQLKIQQTTQLSQPRVMVELCKNLNDKTLQVLWQSVNVDEIQQIISYNQLLQTQLLDDLIINILIYRNRTDILLDERIIKTLNLKNYFYCRGELEFEILYNKLNSLKYYDRNHAVAKIISSIFKENQELHINSILLLNDYPVNKNQQSQEPYSKQTLTDINEQLTKLSFAIPQTLTHLNDHFKYDLSQLIKYQSRDNSDNNQQLEKERICKVFELINQQFQTQLYKIFCINKLNKYFDFEEYNKVFNTISCIDIIIGKQLEIQKNMSFVSFFEKVMQINQDQDIQFRILNLLILFGNIRNVIFHYYIQFNQDQQVDDIKNTIQKPYLISLLDEILNSQQENNQYNQQQQNIHYYYVVYLLNSQTPQQIKKQIETYDYVLTYLIDAVVMTNNPILVSQKIDSIFTTKEELQLLIQLQQMQKHEHLPCQVKLLQQLYKNFIVEINTRMNQNNMSQFLQSIGMYSDQFITTTNTYMIETLLETDLNQQMFLIIKQSQSLTVKLFILQLFHTLYDISNSNQNQLQNHGCLNKTYQNLVCFLLSVVFQLTQNSNLPILFFKYFIINVIEQINSKASYLFLFMLRELLSHVFCNVTQFFKERKKLVDSIQSQQDAYQQFSDRFTEQSFIHLQLFFDEIFWENSQLQTLEQQKEVKLSNSSQNKLLHSLSKTYANIKQNNQANHLIFINLLYNLRINTFTKFLIDNQVNLDELLDLITLTRNDLLFLLNQVQLQQDFIQQQEELLIPIKQTANILYYEVILINKSQSDYEQSFNIQFALCDQQKHPIKQYIMQQFKETYIKQSSEQLFNIFSQLIQAPQFIHDSINQFFTNFIDNQQNMKFIFQFMQFGYLTALSLTRSETDRFISILLNIFNLLDQNKINTFLIYHSWMSSWLFENTYSQQMCEIQYIVQQKYIHNCIVLATSIILADTAKQLDQDSTSVLIRTTTLYFNKICKNLQKDEIINSLQQIIEVDINSQNILFQFIDKQQYSDYIIEKLL